MDILSTKKNTSFKGRCVQIRDAQWVCHTVNTARPHFSTTKIKPMIEKQLNKLREKSPDEQDFLDFSEVYKELKKLCPSKKELSQMSFLQRMKIKFKNTFGYTEEQKHLLKILKNAKSQITNFSLKRQKCSKFEDEIHNALLLMERFHLANCNETARLAELILQINGIRNAKTVLLKAEKQNCTLDHAVCVFNRDGSNFSKITRNTIVVDPWVGKADFAGNMIKFYKNECKALLSIPQEQKIGFVDAGGDTLFSKEIKRYRKRCPEFVFQVQNRKFMKNTL